MASYEGATLKVPELCSEDILLPMFVYEDCMAVCSILYTSARGVAEIAKSTNLKGCPHTLYKGIYLNIHDLSVLTVGIQQS